MLQDKKERFMDCQCANIVCRDRCMREDLSPFKKMFIWQAYVAIFAMPTVIYARIVTEYIPGSGCGTVNTIRILKRDPSVQELAIGCLYVMKEVSSFKPRQGIVRMSESNVWKCFVHVTCLDHISEKLSLTLQKIDSVPSGHGIGNVKNLLQDTETETAHTGI